MSLEWTYSFYRASLYRGGRIFAIVTPNGRLALEPLQAAILCDELNALPSNPESLLKRVNSVINVDCFEQTLEAEGSDLIEFQSTWAKYASYLEWPPAFLKAMITAEHNHAQQEVLFP